MPLWLHALIWMAIGAVLFGGGLFAGFHGEGGSGTAQQRSDG
jgi:hypothetical protein